MPLTCLTAYAIWCALVILEVLDFTGRLSRNLSSETEYFMLAEETLL
jgi:hypothetical protein